MLKWWKRLQAVQERVSVPFCEIPSSGQVTSNAGHGLVAGSVEGRGSSVIAAETAAAVTTWGTGVALAKWETMWVHRNRNHKGLESEERKDSHRDQQLSDRLGMLRTRAQILAEGVAAWV